MPPHDAKPAPHCVPDEEDDTTAELLDSPGPLLLSPGPLLLAIGTWLEAPPDDVDDDADASVSEGFVVRQRPSEWQW